MLRFLTSGESHGPGLLAIVDGFPAGLKVDIAKINHELWRRQQGYGRGSRQKIESDRAQIMGGVRHGVTTGAPVGLLINNKDWENWRAVMDAEEPDSTNPEVLEQLSKKQITRFRPGHADLAGTMKFGQTDIRNVLERASARETAARVAMGALCQQLLAELGINLAGHVVQVEQIKANPADPSLSVARLNEVIDESEMFCADTEATERMKALIKATWTEGDSLGGVVEVIAEGLPVGLGSYTQWDCRLDGQLAQALMSIQAIKAVEIGDGVEAAAMPGSQVHDAIYPSSGGNGSLPFCRQSNHAGGIEGGMTNGERLLVRAYMKPIPTLRKGLPSVSFPDFKADTAHFERSDVCAISAASVVCKAMVAFVLARAVMDKFGGDTMRDIKAAYNNYCKSCSAMAQTKHHEATSADVEADSE